MILRREAITWVKLQVPHAPACSLCRTIGDSDTEGSPSGSGGQGVSRCPPYPAKIPTHSRISSNELHTLFALVHYAP
ncbi:hypothetical protein GCM10023190_22960 [Enteractinococcus fodinae]